MNRNKLKTYAPEARRAFIQAVTDRASYFGITATKFEPVTVEGDVAIIGGRAFPKKVAEQRRRLDGRIAQQEFDQVMEAVAYTWFNRLVAIRYMEIHGYLEHGYRVLSHPDGTSTPEIVEHAEHVDLPGLDAQRVIDLKLDGTKDSELYRLLLVAQCNALHKAMPFLFEAVDDETELLLPDNLLHSDSLVRKLVTSIDEEDWKKEVEIVGWLYQFYISEKKDQVIGKVVKSEDIPAATQLFTPNWIVKYLVQNSLGRQWMATYPNSSLNGQMEYYIEPAEQTPEVEAELKAITPESLNPEELTLLDPACGSGHILVEAYDLLKAIYQERGYPKKDIPRLILTKNLFGLEIDDRAAQLAAFALMMKARADDRRIFSQGVQPQVISIQESTGLDAQEITEALNAPIMKSELPPSSELFEELAEDKSPLFSKRNLAVKGEVSQTDVANLLKLFEHGKTFGSLIQVPEELAEKLPAIAQRVREVAQHGVMLDRAVSNTLVPLIRQCECLSRRFDSVVTNPPYMGSKGYNGVLKKYIYSTYKEEKSDLYAAFITRARLAVREHGAFALITIPNWMFISAFELMRARLCRDSTVLSLIHNGRGVWGADFGSCAFVAINSPLSDHRGNYRRLMRRQGEVPTGDELRRRFFTCSTFQASSADFMLIPGWPLAYWCSSQLRTVFNQSPPLGEVATTAVGLFTCDNARFLRSWWEVPYSKIGFAQTAREQAKLSGKKFFPYNKGGGFRRWYGLVELVVQFDRDGEDIRTHRQESGQSYSLPGEEFYFRPGITWSGLTISINSFRWSDQGYLFESNKGQMLFSNDDEFLLALLNSKPCQHVLGLINPTVSLQSNEVKKMPIRRTSNDSMVRTNSATLIDMVLQ